METAGTAIQVGREARGWSLAELARRADCDAGYLGRVERGERNPSPYFVAHVTKVIADGDEVAATPQQVTA